MILCGKFYTSLYYHCKYRLPGGFWRIMTTDSRFQSFHKYTATINRQIYSVSLRYRNIINYTADSSSYRSAYDPRPYDMYNGNFQAKRFQLVSITKMLENNNLCCALSLRFMTCFQSSDETLCEAISTTL